MEETKEVIEFKGDIEQKFLSFTSISIHATSKSVYNLIGKDFLVYEQIKFRRNRWKNISKRVFCHSDYFIEKYSVYISIPSK